MTSYDGYGSVGTPVKPPCGKSVPARPASSSGGGTKALTGAMKLIRFQDIPNQPALGYDLDGLCTCPGKTACRNKLGPDKPCDVPAGTGIDNAAGAILALLYPPSAAQSLTDSLKRGQNGMVVQIQNYNGLKDDADVSVALYNVVGVNGKSDGTGNAAFDGNDEMILDDASLEINTTGPRFTDTSAYVAGGVLVGKLDFDLRLAIPPGTIDAQAPVVAVVPLKAAYIVGKITIVGGTGLEMEDAQLVGRIKENDIFTQISRIGLCQDSGSFEPVKQRACTALDLPAKPGDEAKDLVCDALSLAVGVVIAPARLGGHAAVDNGTGLCGAESLVSCD